MLTPLAKAAEVVSYYTDYGDSCPEQFYPLSPSNLQAMQHNPPAKNELDSLNTEGQQKHEFY